ncbi:MAG: sigma-54-dependent Fis family transcriptional regulator, partial [Planctomycetes bacterium]|nr:sigma-54-dependent Fis family transcriptional regulator [Planctomycetota bacterium]
MRPTVLIVEDEELFRRTLSATLRDEDYEVYSEPSATSALKLLEQQDVDIVITDVRMPGMDGIRFLEEARQYCDSDFIVMSAYGTVETAVEAMKKGASDYIIKPFLFDDVLMRLKRLWEYRSLAKLNAGLRQEIKAQRGYAGLVGAGEKMQRVYELIERVGPINSNILITGESGTGNELVARAIH